MDFNVNYYFKSHSKRINNIIGDSVQWFQSNAAFTACSTDRVTAASISFRRKMFCERHCQGLSAQRRPSPVGVWKKIKGHTRVKSTEDLWYPFTSQSAISYIHQWLFYHHYFHICCWLFLVSTIMSPPVSRHVCYYQSSASVYQNTPSERFSNEISANFVSYLLYFCNKTHSPCLKSEVRKLRSQEYSTLWKQNWKLLLILKMVNEQSCWMWTQNTT